MCVDRGKGRQPREEERLPPPVSPVPGRRRAPSKEPGLKGRKDARRRRGRRRGAAAGSGGPREEEGATELVRADGPEESAASSGRRRDDAAFAMDPEGGGEGSEQ
jgi:hypothetical protein